MDIDLNDETTWPHGWFVCVTDGCPHKGVGADIPVPGDPMTELVVCALCYQAETCERVVS